MRVGATECDLLLAIFPLSQGAGAVGFQLQDEHELRRGGVYWLPEDDATRAAYAPRFDELFADLAAKLSAAPELREPVRDLLRQAHALSTRCLPRLTPETLSEIARLALAAAALDRPELPGAFPLEASWLCFLLIFVSEEERYPKPKYKGADVLLERLLDVV